MSGFQILNYANIEPRKMVNNPFAEMLAGYEMSHRPGQLERERFKSILENQKLGHETQIKGHQAQHEPGRLERLKTDEEFVNVIKGAKAKYAEPMENATLQEKLANAFYKNEIMGRGRGGRAGEGSAREKTYAPTGSAKLMLERHDVEEGFLPGSGRKVRLSPEQQQEYLGHIDLQMQKNRTDAGVRQRSLFANNLVQSIDNANVDDLVRYSGPKGHLELAKEMANDSVGNPSENYIKYKEAQKAVALEAQELRQFLGTSITPSMDKALRDMVDATSIGTSPEVAKRQIEKSRGIIKKQLGTYQEALRSTKPYTGKQEAHEMELDTQEVPAAQDYSNEELMRIIGGQ